jgi:hypothetical protein
MAAGVRRARQKPDIELTVASSLALLAGYSLVQDYFSWFTV